jgi:hypothetical protein
MEWQQVENNFVLAPTQPKGVIHFLGGAFFAAAPHISYSRVLETLAQAGYVIVATPFTNSTFDHRQIAIDVYKSFKRTRSKLFLDYFPLFGMGHSMGCKIHLLINCLYPSERERSGNIFIAYNNYGAKQSIPLFKEFSGTIPEMSMMEFTPSPLETMELINQRYEVANNLLIKFIDDDIDEIAVLATQLKRKFNDQVTVQTLAGTHITSMGMDMKWQAGQSFTPVDAIFQWIRQGVHKDNSTLEQTLLTWLRSHKPKELENNFPDRKR